MFLIWSSSTLCQSIEARCEVENEDVAHVAGAAPTGDAPTTSLWIVINSFIAY